ncbi:unnamed protein product [Caenorhabditis sp. 36 PRJEB53466]|nr:unnamed protein product [Caenorhabditis sp. 36 PRJEB53466]
MVLRRLLCCRRVSTPSASASGCAKLFLLLLSANSIIVGRVGGQLPDQLDPFLEKLFEFEECEDFLGSTEYNNIATTKCDPLTCDFPRQLCARPSAKFQDSSANTCRTIPTECLTAANGGVPLAPSVQTTSSPFMPQPLPNAISPMMPAPTDGQASPPPDPLSICQMGVPNGRFCGFRPMYIYNRETMQCDDFWFPGCRTADTNANLFEDYQQCQKVADMCRPTPPPPTLPPFRPRPPAHRPHPPRTIHPPPPPPHQPAPSPFVDAFKSFGGGGGNSPVGQGALGAIGMFTGSGLAPTGQGPLGNFAPNPNAGAAGGGGGQDGQDLGLFGLIQQGIMGAQAAGQGKGGKEAASKAAGKILEQFTGFDLGGLGNNFGGLFGR